MEKLLLLGGSAQQVTAIETAKKLGLYTVLCDYLPDNPGQYAADKFYLVSTTEKEAVLDVARKEAVRGVIAYASDPAAGTAAYVAEVLGLPTNPYSSVEILCSKDRFRSFLRENGFCVPAACGYDNVSAAMQEKGQFTLPVIVKPVDSSGSKGVTVLHTWEGFEEAFAFALSFSRSKRVIVEEFIEKNHPYLIGGDVFIIEGKIVLWGLMNCHRDPRVNPLVPVGKSYPPALSAENSEQVKNVLQAIVDKLGIRFGAMNVELVVDKENRVFPIDIGPRNGGNMIPELLSMIFGVDVVELSVRAAMGMPYEGILNVDFPDGFRGEGPCYATYNMHALKDGIYRGVRFSEKAERFLVRKSLYKKPGDFVEYFDNASKALGIVFFRFENAAQMREFMAGVHEEITVLTDGFPEERMK